MDTFGKRLVYARKKRDMSQKQLAELMGITPTRLNYWEKDKREPDIQMLKKLSEILKFDSDFLIGNWSDDFFEDYAHARNDEERLMLFNLRGVPPGLRADYKRMVKEEEDRLSESEVYLLSLYRQLNDEGREKLLSYADDLVESGKYRPVVKKENAV